MCVSKSSYSMIFAAFASQLLEKRIQRAKNRASDPRRWDSRAPLVTPCVTLCDAPTSCGGVSGTKWS